MTIDATTPPPYPLDRRIALTVPGQATWARPELGRHCTACRHFAPERDRRHPPGSFGRCRLVRAVTGRAGKPFHGALAHACSKFDEDRP